MTESSDKPQNRTQTIEEFKKVDVDLLEERYNRYLWTVKEWNRVIGRKLNRPPHINTLYVDGSCAFFYGYYSASILTITTTIELTLKAIVDLSKIPSKRQQRLLDVINEAVKQDIISNELADRLHFLRKNIRNIITHKQDMASHMTVGWEKDPTSKTRFVLDDKRLEKLAQLQRDSKESFFTSREVFARETIQLLFQVFQSVITSGKDWSNLV